MYIFSGVRARCASDPTIEKVLKDVAPKLAKRREQDKQRKETKLRRQAAGRKRRRQQERTVVAVKGESQAIKDARDFYLECRILSRIKTWEKLCGAPLSKELLLRAVRGVKKPKSRSSKRSQSRGKTSRAMR